MTDIPLALAAGLVAAFNPCGFALLPGYLTLLLAGEGPAGPRGIGRALGLSATMTAGFIAVFGGYGLAATLLALALEPYLPWVTVVVGIALVGAGLWLVSGRELLIRVPRIGGVGGAAGPVTGWASMFGYGASYAVASLSCTIAPFLAVTATAFRTSGLADGLAVFVAYGLGMGLVVGLLAMAVALARTALVARMRRALPHVSRASGILLLLAGGYVAYYGWYELRVNAGGSAEDPVVDLATNVQGAVARWLDGIGVRWIATAFVLIGAAVVLAWVRGRRSGAAAPARSADGARHGPP